MNQITELKITKSQIEKLSINLKNLLYDRRLSEGDVAHSLGIPVMTIRRIVSGETTDPRISTLKLIADFFGVTVDSLIDETANSINKSCTSMPCFIPILDWTTLEDISSITDIDLNVWKEWQPIFLGNDSSLREKAFALESRPSMQPRFPIGTLFIIDPDEKPIDGDIILIRMKNDGSLSLRELVVDSPKWQLIPIVVGSEIIFYDNTQHSITGIVILSMFRTRQLT